MFWTTFRWKRLTDILRYRKEKGKKIAQFFNEACDCVGYGYVYIVFAAAPVVRTNLWKWVVVGIIAAVFSEAIVAAAKEDE